MKNNFKFIVAVFGVTLAIFGSTNSNALADANAIRCRDNASPHICAIIQKADGTLFYLHGFRF
ncbi:hypothetical protein [Flavobacterium sp.]|uniref:hypothetical protein n=1 Tax=Flavobacterium sp. TaxID=239 RepID=UPI00375185AB